MNKRIMNRWHRSLQSQLQSVHAYQVHALATFSFAIACAQDCCLSRITDFVPTPAQPQSIRRRLIRLLGNEKLEVEAICAELAGWLKRWDRKGARLNLLLDETPLRNDVRVLKISVAYHRRSLPLLWTTYPLKNRDERMPQTVQKLLKRVAQIIQTHAARAQVVLMADRGLCWPSTIKWCEEHGWDYVLRAKAETLVKGVAQPDLLIRRGRSRGTCHLGDLAPERGRWWYGPAQIFRKAGWIECNVVACWPHEAQEAWLLVTNLPPSLHLCRWYSKRSWLEQSFRDEKSHGFNWQQSRVRDPERVHRLLLVLALAHLWLMLLGDVGQRPEWRVRLGLTSRSNRRLWSRFRTGVKLLFYALKNNPLIPCELTFTPT